MTGNNLPAHRPSLPRFRLHRPLLLLLAFVAVAGLGCQVACYDFGTNGPSAAQTEPVPAPEPRSVAPRTDLQPDEVRTIELFERASPSVVFITTSQVRRDFFSMNLHEIPRGSGSGFIWDRQGHVITNFHVINGASRARVTLADRSSWDASLVGAAAEKDLAVLQIEAPPERLPPIPVGRSYDLAVGQKVLAIGNPFGFDQTLTTGIISALGREIESLARIPIRDVIQTDAAINPGNSGGPLLDSSGRLIGVNTAIYSPSGSYAGIGFAIPVDTVNWVVPELIANGKLVRPTLGIEMASDQIVRNLGLEGALVTGVVRGSGADEAGIRPTRRDRYGRVELGDLIVSIDGELIRSSNDLLLLLERYEPGQTVQVTVERDGERETLRVPLGEAR